MNSLNELQTSFQAYLVDSKDEIEKHVVSTNKVPARTRLAIYGEAYHARLVDALASNYPMLYAYLGSEQFDILAHQYLASYPSSFPSIRWFGDRLPSFLTSWDEYNDVEYLSELATVEWTMTLVFDAADASVLQLDDVVAIPPEAWVDMRLEPHPSLHVLPLSWNVMAIWHALSEKQVPPAPVQGKTVTWMFWRSALVNRFCSLSVEEAWAVEAVCQGKAFGEICEGLCQWVDEDEAAMRAASLLKGWLSEGLLKGIQP